jgi:hypothetical protein
MNRISDLNVIKGRDIDTQRAVIDELVERYGRTANGVEKVLSEILGDDLGDLSAEPPEQALRYAFLAMIAADIATVPYMEGRAFHMEGFSQLASGYGLSMKKVVYLTRYADE